MPGKYIFAGTILLLTLLLPILVPVAGAQGSGSLIRGNTFTVTVVGNLRTPYDIWLKGTHSMSGEPGDQPPIIVPGQVDVVQDPPGGPYVIGSTHINGGGGTILDDVALTSSVVSATSYYAEVTTDLSGYGVVLFRTSSATAIQQFHIVAQNPADPNEDVQVVLGVPSRVPTPMMPLPLPTTMHTPLMPATTTPVPGTPVQPTPAPTPVTLQTGTPTQNPVQETPVAKIPIPDFITIAAAGIGILWVGRKRE